MRIIGGDLHGSAPAALRERPKASAGLRGAAQPSTLLVYCEKCGTDKPREARRFGNGYLCACGTYLGWLAW